MVAVQRLHVPRHTHKILPDSASAAQCHYVAIAVIVVVVNLLADLSYMLVDPRVLRK